MYTQIIAYIDAYIDITLKDNIDEATAENLKQSLYDSLIQKYDMLVSSGSSEKEAYHATISTLKENIDSIHIPNKKSYKNAFLTSLAIFIFIISIGSFPLLESIVGANLTIFIFFLFIGIGVCLLIFNALSNSPAKNDNSNSSDSNSSKPIIDEIKSFFSVVIWIGSALVFFLIKDMFSYPWIIFFIPIILECLFSLILSIIKSTKK